MHGQLSPPTPRLARQIEIGRVTIEVVEMDRDGARPAAPRPRTEGGSEPPYLVVVSLCGCASFNQDGRAGLVAPGEYVLLSQKSYHELSAEPGSSLLLLRVPSPDLRGRIASIDDHLSRRFTPNERMGRLLVDLLRGVTDIFVDGLPPNPEALATEIVSFVALTLSAEDRGSVIDVRNGRYQLRRRIFDYIESNLGDQNLSPRRIAASSRISMSYLYSLFNDDGTTVSQFVQVKRLQRAYELLVADARGHRTVSEIAYEVGFKNVSHFSRTFSRHFRMAPRDARQAGRVQGVQKGDALLRGAGRRESPASNFPIEAFSGLRPETHQRATSFGNPFLPSFTPS